MNQGGWQPLVSMPAARSTHQHDPVGYLLLPLMGFLLVSSMIAAVLIDLIRPIFGW